MRELSWQHELYFSDVVRWGDSALREIQNKIAEQLFIVIKYKTKNLISESSPRIHRIQVTTFVFLFIVCYSLNTEVEGYSSFLHLYCRTYSLSGRYYSWTYVSQMVIWYKVTLRSLVSNFGNKIQLTGNIYSWFSMQQYDLYLYLRKYKRKSLHT